MEQPAPAILRFIKQHKVLTLATCVDEEPWCAHCFYVYLPDLCAFIFTSDTHTKHIQHLCHNCYVAGGIALESRVGKLRGLQFQGVTMPVDDALQERAHAAYLKRFPVARAMQLKLWRLDVMLMKYTDNRLGFKTKLHWQRETPWSEAFKTIIPQSP